MNSNKTGLLFAPLYLLSKIYGLIITIRRSLYKVGIFRSRKLEARVISIGNIAVGGTGKTPAVIYIAKLLAQNGHKVCVLSRGYKGTNKSEYLEVSNGTDVLSDPVTAGDEPYMMAKRLTGIPVIVGRDRYIAGKRAVEKFSPDVCILDDGFSHMRLKRDLDIVTFNGNTGFGNSRLLPAGILREQASALKRADIVLVNKGDKEYDEIAAGLSKYKGDDARILKSRYEVDTLTSLTGETKGPDYVEGKRVFAVSALADAGYFYEMIESLGGVISGKLEYSDHYYYSGDDYKKMIDAANSANANMILTTEKDIVKFDSDWIGKGDIGMFSLNVSLVPEDEQVFNNIFSRFKIER